VGGLASGVHHKFLGSLKVDSRGIGSNWMLKYRRMHIFALRAPYERVIWLAERTVN